MDSAIQDYKQTSGMGGASGYLTIDLRALARNYEKLAAEIAPARAAAVVKANAYGLGAHRVATKLYEHGCRDFFVAQFVEALHLRPILAADATIFVLNGLQPSNVDACASEGIVPIINSLEQWHQWAGAALALGRRLPAVLQFDTGMSRLGLSPEERAALAGLLKAGGAIDVLFIMSHLASADDTASQQNGTQLNEMNRIAAEFPEFDVCFANSGGVFLGEAYHGVLARPGIALYGGAPTAGMQNPMEPIVQLDVAVVQTRTVPAGTPVGYGGAHVTTGETRLATIAAGYADGLPRSLSDRGAVYCDGIRLPILGRVSMDSMTVNISTLPEDRLRLGSLVEVIGPNQTLEDIAREAGTISYEILTCLGHRYERRYR
ncbi:alanine racemase [Sinorhizobium meliloti]|uniref:alanine racemase n=1 Tax=Rhizobium meliloti TaxID=382 RepID=UPI000FD3F868|nr:alanine racemase [Sinorhizobium meliloti]MQV24897.1 alanine racemase [Sinorhizobium meliloti]MQV37433.1 alanine racemase [Sinorhizobium meliloti]RVE78958.1 alanine racemase [Sinorhizobium meliloti]RVG42644.1 alanine racemase [Sinorhizobium meliloti]RVM08260.1 alanine racemase [Sinorhizobium meliloti]